MMSTITALTLMLLVCFIGIVICQKPWEPTPKPDAGWLQRHQQFRNITASQGDKIQIVFIGSSSIANWASDGKAIWDAKYAPLGSVNYGIGGDRTEHTLWRIQDGELDGLNPKLVVVYVGSNNLGTFPDNNDIVRGMDAVVTMVHERVPNANVLLLGIFPRGNINPVSHTLQRIQNISIALDGLVDGDTQRRSHFLDIFEFLAPPSMDRINEEFYQGDKVHFNTLGYQLWDREMNSTFYSLLN